MKNKYFASFNKAGSDPTGAGSLVTIILTVLLTIAANAQSTAFTYQGKLTDNGTAANGTYDIEFRLFDVESGGSSLAVQQKLSVQVTDGVFAVQLDYGAASFNGSARFLETAVRPANGNSFTTMSPRSLISSTPYSIKSLRAATADTATNAAQLGGVSAATFVQTSDPRMSDARTPSPGSASYIQNGNNPQAGGNFNISGTGVANIFNAAMQYNIAGKRALAITGASFDGINASNTFAGSGSGAANVPSGTIEGEDNSFYGTSSGQSNTTGYDNSFFGFLSGYKIVQGFDNSFFGSGAGDESTSGFGNSFYGRNAGATNTAGRINTAIGSGADVGSGNLVNATAIGADTKVTQSNSLVLGNNANVGIGTGAPSAKLHIVTNGGNILAGNAGCVSGFVGFGFASSLTCTNYSLLGNGTDTIINRTTGGAIHFRENNTTQLTINPGGTVAITTLGSAGSTQLCRNASNQIATCSSSLRYKTNIAPFRPGMALLNRLQPITFNWKDGGMADLGFGAEDVAKVEPLLVTHNDKGEVEGVKYDRISAVLVNAVQEQQSQIVELKRKLEILTNRLNSNRQQNHARHYQARGNR